MLLTNLQPLKAQVDYWDSLYLVEVYDQLGGEAWFNNTNWKTGAVKTWFGVELNESGNNVQGLRLSNNNLIGKIPENLGLFYSLDTLDLSNNNLYGVIHYNFVNLQNLKYLDLRFNELTGDSYFLMTLTNLEYVNMSNNNFVGTMPMFSENTKYVYYQGNEIHTIPNMEMNHFTYFDVSYNQLTFYALANANIQADFFTYAPQNKIHLSSNKAQAAPGYYLSMNILDYHSSISNANNQYQWYKNGVILDGEVNWYYQMEILTASDLGYYSCEITNSLYPALTLQTDSIVVSYLSPDAGQNDTVCYESHFLSGNDPFPYEGAWTTTSSATILSPSTNSTEIVGLNLGDNAFKWNFNGESDEIIITRLVDLSAENIMSGTDQTVCADHNWVTLNATDPAPYDHTYGEWYSGTAMYEKPEFETPNLYNTQVYNLQIGENYLYWTLHNACSTSSSSPVVITVIDLPYAEAGENKFVGKDSIYLEGYISNEGCKGDPKCGNEGVWSTNGNALILEQFNMNTKVENLELGKNYFYLTVTSPEGCVTKDTVIITYNNKVSAQDSLALVSLYNSTNGNNWNNNSGWKVAPIVDWYGVVISERYTVTHLYLFENGLNGVLPTDLGNLIDLRYLDVSYNSLSGKIPQSVSDIENLQYAFYSHNMFSEFPDMSNDFYYNFDISYNNFDLEDFDDIEGPECEIITYTPQNPIAITQDTIFVENGSQVVLNLDVLSKSVFNQARNVYQWYKDGMPIEESVPFSGVQSKILTINPISIVENANYTCQISNGDIPLLVLETMPIRVQFQPIPTNGIKEVCSDIDTLKAFTSLDGYWISHGQATILNASSQVTVVQNLMPGENYFTWVSNEGIGEVTLINNSVTQADAGLDKDECYDFTYLLGNMTMIGGYGMWISEGSAVIESNGGTSALVTNLALGENKFVYKIQNGICFSSDTVIITSYKPIVDAGNDTIIYWDTYPIPNASLNLNATPAPEGFTGVWTTYTSGVIIENLLDPKTSVSGIGAGMTNFEWVVTNNQCTYYDYVNVLSANVIRNAVDTVIWDNPEHWTPAVVPSYNDSVIVENCYVKIFGIYAFVGSLRIGSGAYVYVKESPENKSLGSLTGGQVVIEQDVEKSFKTGTAVLNIGSGGQVVIEQDVEKSMLSTNAGLQVGSGGQVVIEQDVEKGSKSNPAMLYMQGSSQIIVQETNPTVSNPANFFIGNGGEVQMAYGYVKANQPKANSGANLYIGSGGTVVIEQDVEKGTKANPAITIGSGGTVVIEQDVEKKTKSTNAALIISGGTVVIEQDVEKGATLANNEPSIIIGEGGELTIEPNIISGTLDAPIIKVAGGLLEVGNDKKTSGKGKINTGQVVIEQDVEKKYSAKTTPDMIVFGNGLIEFVEMAGFENQAFLNVGECMVVTFNEGAEINVPLLTLKSILETEETSSIIDLAGVITGNIVLKQFFEPSVIKLVTPPLSGTFANLFNGAELQTWNEMFGEWRDFGFIDALQPMNGFKVKFNQADTIKYLGIVNMGNQSLNIRNSLALSESKRGFNLVGNPYTAAIDWESVSLDKVETAFYSYNEANQNFGIYQKGGYALNGADQYIDQSEGFVVKTTLNAINPNLNFIPENLIHNINGLVTKTPYKNTVEGLKLSVANNAFSDEIILRFDASATLAYDESLDVFKMFAFNEAVPQLYTLGANNENLAINVSPFPVDYQADKVIPLNFKSSTSGNYTLSVNEFTYTDKVIYLKDLKNNQTMDLRTVKTYNFAWDASESTNRFQLLFNTTVGIDNVENSENFEVFSNQNQIFVDVKQWSKNTKIQVYSVLGTKILETEIESQGVNQFTLDQPTGNYIVKILSEKENFVKKVFLTKI